MNWTYSLRHKLTAGFLLGSVMLLVLWNNLGVRSSSREIEESIETIYKDRLIAESLILDLSESLHEIKEILPDDGLSLNEKKEATYAALMEINRLTVEFKNTRLTNDEDVKLKAFIFQCHKIANKVMPGNFDQGSIYTKDALSTLRELSSIQLTEARSVIKSSRSIFSSLRIKSMFEIALLIVIGLIIQAIIFASKTEKVDSVPPFLN